MKEEQITNKEMDMLLQDCYLHRIRLLSRTITNIYDNALKPMDLKVTQMNMLGVVTKLGPISPGDMSQKLGMDKSTLSRNVERLIDYGWLELLPGDDGRSHQLRITEKGRGIMNRASKYWRQAQAKTRKILGKDGSKAIMSAGNILWKD